MIKHHCRHCGTKHIRIYRAFKYKTYDKVYPIIREYILGQIVGDYICVEYAAIETRCTFGLTRKAFMQLNREGILSQRTNEAPHDSTRDHMCGGPGGDSAWMASYYTVLKDKSTI